MNFVLKVISNATGFAPESTQMVARSAAIAPESTQMVARSAAIAPESSQVRPRDQTNSKLNCPRCKIGRGNCR